MQRARVKPERGPPRSKRAAARKERRLDPRSDHAERQHGIGDLLEAGDVGPPDIVDEVAAVAAAMGETALRSEEHTSELQSLMRISYAVFCLKQKRYREPRSAHQACS